MITKKLLPEARKNESGFTLVELLIVVAIIGILAAIAIPQYAQYKKKSAQTAATQALSSCISSAVAKYADSGNTTHTCPITSTETCTLTVSETDGSVSTSGACTPTVKGISLTCTIGSGNVPSCS